MIELSAIETLIVCTYIQILLFGSDPKVWKVLGNKSKILSIPFSAFSHTSLKKHDGILSLLSF